MKAWLQAGTQLVLVADPKKRRITVHRAGGEAEVFSPGESVDASAVVPGWHLAVAEVFPED